MAATALTLLGLTSSLSADELFYLPNMEEEVFDIKKLKFGEDGRGEIDRVGLAKALVRIASDFDEEDDVESDLRSNALGIGGRIMPDMPAFKRTYDQLKDSAKAFGDEGTNKSRLIGNIYLGVQALLSFDDNKDNKKCAAYCVDVALRLDPNHRFADELEGIKDDLKAEKFVAKWDDLKGEAVVKDTPWNPFGQRGEMKPRKVEMPGGKADTFASKQRSIYGLVVVTLPGGKHAGAASEISASALKNDGDDDIVFKIEQKVGDMMANSLDSIVKYMRVKYEDTDKVPAGYEVSILFEDRDTLTDGPSAGTAMALMIDALFSGEELDERFACTGGITPSGKCTKIGGVAAKIRGATRRNCNIVGVPEGNANGVNDILILKGIDRLLEIQIFTMKDFDEARAISRKEKDSDTQKTLDDFNQVAGLIREKGEDLLKNSEVQKKLRAILDQMPNHMSAKLLLEYAEGNPPSELSVGGSFHEIDSRASGIFSRVQQMMFQDKYAHGSDVVDDAKDALKELKEIDGKVDKRFNDYLASAIELCELVEEGRGDDDEDVFLKRLKSKWQALQNQRKKLSTDPALREEMMN